MQRLRARTAEHFASSQQAEAMALLRDGLADGDPVLLLTGAAGLGKTTVLQQALAVPERAGARTLPLQPPFPPPLVVHGQLAALAGLGDGEAAAPAVLAASLHQLAVSPNGVAVTVALDGADAVPAPLLRYLWLIHTLCATERPALQLVLVGRDALWRRLADDDLAGLRRAVSARIALQPWAEAEMAGLFAHALLQRGRRADTDAAAEALRLAAGVPGRLLAVLDAACSSLPPRRSLSLSALQAGLSEPGQAGQTAPSRAPVLAPMAALVLPHLLRPLRGRTVPVAAGVAALAVAVGAVRLLSGPAAAPIAPKPSPRLARHSAAPPNPSVTMARSMPIVPHGVASPPPPAVLPAPSRGEGAVAEAPALPDAMAPVRFARDLALHADAAGAEVAGWVRVADRTMIAMMPPAESPRLASATSAPQAPLASPPAWRAYLGPAVAVAARTLPPFLPPSEPAPTPAPASPPAERSAGQAMTAPNALPATAPLLVMADATAIRVTLLYPRGDAPAEARAERAAAALEAQHIDAAAPRPVARPPSRSGVSYFFTADLEGAQRVASVVAGLIPPGPIEALPMQASPPPPGTVQVILTGR